MAKLDVVIGRGATADKPASPTEGYIYFDTDLNKWQRYSGASWEDVDTFLARDAELVLTAAGGWPSTTNGCAVAAQSEYGTNDVDLYTADFDPDSDEYMQWTVWLPDDYDAGTITAEFCWTGASGSGDVVWGLQGRAYANDDAVDQAFGTAQEVTDTLIATDDIHYTSETSAITLAGTPTAGELVQFRAFRNADDGSDTFTGDAQLIAVKIRYGRS